MRVFVLFVFGVYGGIHVYAFLKARQAFGFGWGIGAALALFMLLMVAAVFLVHWLEDRNFELAARTLSYIAYLWMSVVFLFCCGSAVIDLSNLLARAAAWAGGPALPRIPPRFSLLLSLVPAALITIYGYFDAQNIRVERLVIETDKLPAGTDRLTIAQVSDVHLGLIIRCDRLVNILEAVKEARPDVVLATGDIVDAQINHLHGLRELLQDIKAPRGKFAITGNHEYYAGLDKAAEFIRSSGFTLLQDEAADIGPIIIAGVNDRTAAQVGLPAPARDRTVLERLDRRKFILFMKHQPHPDPDGIGLFDLMLSGHTHRGQIWPFTLFVKRVHPLIAGRYDVGKGSIVYTSRGSGTWGPPVRFLSPPEVTVIELVRKRSG